MSEKNITKYSKEQLLIAPSLLAAEFLSLKKQLSEVEQYADMLHIDVMDGHLVPNISMGQPVIKSIRKSSNILFDVHLMITNPLKYIESFAEAGADHITFHIECEDNIEETICLIKKCGLTVGLTLKPNTKIESIFPYLDLIDMVLVMSVEPGFGGQSFMPEMMKKCVAVKEKIESIGKNILLQVDGGIDASTIKCAYDSGARIMVAGTSVFKHKNGIKEAIELLHSSVK